jgi:hypothetical protein
MDHSIAYVAIALCLVAIAAGLNYARLGFTRKRRDYRMSQALRRGLELPDGVQLRCGPRVIQWQSCETGSMRLS